MSTEQQEWEIGTVPTGTEPVCEVSADSGADSLSVAVMEAVRRATGDPPDAGTLYRAVDPDALDALFDDRPDGTPRAGGVVSFPVEDCMVTVYGDGTVTAAVLD